MATATSEEGTMAAEPAVAAPVSATVTTPVTGPPIAPVAAPVSPSVGSSEAVARRRPNASAWRYAFISAAALWMALLLALVTMDRPFPALTYLAPLVLSSALVALVATRLPVRVPPVAYPVVIMALATLVNAPVLELVF
jgi:hypothetical protein